MTVSFYIALCCLIFIMLSLHVVKGRRQHRIAVGDGGNENMLRRIRAQANFAEYAPFFLLLLGVAELGGLNAYWLHCFGVLFILGRISHVYAILKAEKMVDGRFVGWKFRAAGMYLTLGCMGLLSIIVLLNYFSSLMSLPG